MLPCLSLAQLDAMETKAIKIIGISHAEAESMGLSLSTHRQVGGLSVFYHLLSGLAPSALPVLCPPGFFRAHMVHHQPLLVKLPKSRITAHLVILSSFSPPVESTSSSLQSQSSLQVFKIAVPR